MLIGGPKTVIVKDLRATSIFDPNLDLACRTYSGISITQTEFTKIGERIYFRYPIAVEIEGKRVFAVHVDDILAADVFADIPEEHSS